MLSLQTNAASLFTKSNLSASQSALTSAMTRLGTGLRINSSMDDAAGLQIATRLDAQSRGMQAAMKNTQNGISMLQTADGALSEVSNILLRMKDLATEGANGTASTDDKAAMQGEYDKLSLELYNIMNNTTFGGAKLLMGGKLDGSVTFQIGATASETMSINLDTTGTGELDTLNTALVAVSANNYVATSAGAGTEIGAAATITTVNTAIDALGKARSAIGASANRLDHVYNNLSNVNNNTQIAKGRIMDTDYASETATMTTKQMLMQAGTSMLKQSGTIGQLAMSLMQ